MKNILILLSFLIIPFTAIHAQILTTEDAIAIALKNNFDILVAANDASIASTNNTLGNAGMLPAVSITGSDNYAVNNIDQKYLSAGEIKASDARTSIYAAGIALNWTLFDGGKMFVTKSKLGEIQAMGEIQYRDKIQQTVYNVILAYYDVVRQKQQLVSLEEVITYNQERVKISQTSFNAGLSPKTNLLQAKIDLNVYLENAIHQQSVIIEAKRTLNQILARDSDIVFEVGDTIPLNYVPDKIELVQKLYSNNTSVLTMQKQVEVARLSIREFNASRLPKINFVTAYSLSNTNNTKGSILMNQSFGPSIGLTVSIPLYQSGNTARQAKVAKIQLQSSEFDLENIKQLVNVQLKNAINEFDSQQELLQIERENVQLAKENLEITMQRLRYGQTTSLEVRQAQESYEDSRTRLINFEYNLKVAETKLKQLLATL